MRPGFKTADLCRKHGVSSATFFKWKAKFGGMDVSDARKLKALEDENRKLKKLLAETMLDVAMLKDLNSKKMVTPVVKRQAVVHLCQSYEVSQRRACQVIAADRTSMRYRSVRPDDAVLRARLRELAAIRRRFGYRRLLILIRREGTRVNHKKLRRLYRDERLQVRRRGGRKRALGTWAPMAIPQGAEPTLVVGLPERPAQRQPPVPHPRGGGRLHPGMPGARGRYFAIGPAGRARTRCHRRTARQASVDRQRQRHGVHQHGDPELVAGGRESSGTTSRLASRPRTPSSRASTAVCATRCSTRHSSHRSLTLAGGAGGLMEDYNTVRPHSAIGNVPPAIYAKLLSDPAMQRDGSLRFGGYAPRPVASPSQQGSNEGQALLPTG